MKNTSKVSRMVRSLKINLFKPVKVETIVPKIIDGVVAQLNGKILTGRNITTVSSFVEIDGHITANNDYCDLRPIKERYLADKRLLFPSCVENILSAEALMTEKYYKLINDKRTLYDFISIDVSAGDDNLESVQHIKDLICYDGLYIPFDKLKVIGYEPHTQAEIIILDGVKYVRYRVSLQSASENRLTKVTASTYPWKILAETISAEANYLYNPTQTAVKSIARLGLAKTGGKIVKGFHFTFALLPDLELEIEFRAKCFYDSENKIVEELIQEKKNCNDGHGFILPHKARELAKRLELNYVPSAFQVRYGQVKGILLVFDYEKYTRGQITEDILFTSSMWKDDFNVDSAELLVANLSKPSRKYCEWNYQMFCSLNNQLTFSDILPYVEKVKEYMDKALNSPEDALQFLGLLSDIEPQNEQAEEDDSVAQDAAHEDMLSSITKLAAVIKANPKLAMNLKWVRKGIKKRISLVCQKMLSGKLPMPESSIAIMGTDPIAFFNRIKVDNSVDANKYGYVDETTDSGKIARKYRYNFTHGADVVPESSRLEELITHEFYYGGFVGQILAFRNPLTHWAQIRKLDSVSSVNREYWYKHLSQLILFNVYDETNLGMGGSDFDGDFCFLSKLFVDKFHQADYIIYNGNDTGKGQPKEILTEYVVQQTIRKNLSRNLLGVIVNLNTRIQELLNDKKALERFIALAHYTDNRSFGMYKCPQTPYADKFLNMEAATEYLTGLNHSLTTLSELEVDRPKTGYVNRFNKFQKEYVVPFFPLWFSEIKGFSGHFLNLKPEEYSQSQYGEKVRRLSKNYGGKLVKVITDTLKKGRYGDYVRRTIEMMSETESIMSGLFKYVQENILSAEIDTESCYDIGESLRAASILNMDKAYRIYGEVLRLNNMYSRDVASYVVALKEGIISDEEFSLFFQDTIDYISEKLRELSDDRAAIAYACYIAAAKKKNNTQSFTFMVCLDGMVSLLNDINTIDFYEIELSDSIPTNASHIIVYRGKYRLPESVDPSKTLIGEVAITNGSYEIHRDLKGTVSLIVPKPVAKDRVNTIPYNRDAEFSLKLSYKASELSDEHKNGEYITGLMKMYPVTFKEITMQDNIQYGVFAGDTWIATVFDDTTNTWVLKKEIVRTLLDNEYSFVGTPRTGKKVDNNSFVTSTGKPRTAQIVTFKRALDGYGKNDSMSDEEISHLIQQAEESYIYECMYR